MLVPHLSCIKTVAITMLAVYAISIIISTYVTAVEAKLDQSQTDKAYLDCWNNLQCRQHIDQKFNATNLPNCLDTDDVGICYDSIRHQVQQ
jgi:Na+-transporting NADH:ubiquinone oxidoreductase subunit NqrC